MVHRNDNPEPMKRRTAIKRIIARVTDYLETAMTDGHPIVTKEINSIVHSEMRNTYT